MSDSLQPHGLYRPWNSLGQNTGVGSLSLLQGVFTTQGSNPGLPHCRWVLDQLSHRGCPRILEWVTYPFSSGSSQPRNQFGISCIAGRFFTNWAIREAPLRMAVIKKSTNSKCGRRCEIKGALLYCWWECKLVHTLWKTVCIYIERDISIYRDTLWSCSPTPGHISRKKNIIWKDTCTPVFIAAMFTIGRIWEVSYVFINRGMNKEDVVHIYNTILRSHKK